MNELSLGKQIREFRKRKGITQEELAGQIGISVQAVSKWENGGSPDIELLPALADFFHVSLDELFDRTYQPAEGIDALLTRAVNQMKEGERFHKIMEYCWAMERGFCCSDAELEQSWDETVKRVGESRFNRSRMEYDAGITLMRLGNTFSWFFVMPESQWGYVDQLKYRKEFLELFSFLGSETGLKSVYFLHSRKVKTVTENQLSDALGIDAEDTKNLVDKLIKYHFLLRQKAAEDKEIFAIKPNPAFVALLALTDELLCDTSCYTTQYEFRNDSYLGIDKLMKPIP